jgi:hypothetical protein
VTLDHSEVRREAMAADETVVALTTGDVKRQILATDRYGRAHLRLGLSGEGGAKRFHCLLSLDDRFVLH